MAFDDETIDVLIGGYLSKDAALEDYESVLDCGGYLHGAVVVTKDLEGELEVQQTDHMVREGAAGLGAIGFAVGLFAHRCWPPPPSEQPSEPVPASSSTTGRRTSSGRRQARPSRSVGPA